MRKPPFSFAVGLVMAAGLSVWAGCASFPPPKETIPNSRIFETGFDDMWDSVLATLSELNIPVKSMEKESGNIVAKDETIELRQYEFGRYDSIYCFCGSPEENHVLKELVGEYTISVSRETDVRTSVTIDASFQASQYSGDRVTGRFPCLSKGIFEPIFLERLVPQVPTRKEPLPRKLDWWKPSREY